MNKKRVSTLMLFATTLIWGMSFLAIQSSFSSGWSPFVIVWIRSLIGGLVCLPFCFKSKWWKNKGLIIDSMLCGVFYFMGFIFQSFGQLQSTISNAAFLTTLNVLFVPLILLVFMRKHLEKKVYIAASIALIGTGILSLDGRLSVNVGDIYLILCAVGFALQIIFAQKAAQHQQLFAAGAIQLFTMSILSFIGMAITNNFYIPSQGWGSILYAGIFATGLCGIFQMFAQRHVSPSTTSIIYSFESAIAASAAVIFGYQAFAMRTLIGGIFMISAVLIVELDFQSLVRKRLVDKS